MEPKKIKLVLCWHMHQPHYRDGLNGEYRLPWVYLHAIKDYTDMVAHLEKLPGAKVVVNFAPVLLEQLDDYAKQMRSWLHSGTHVQDALLNWVSGETKVTQDLKQRFEIVQACQKAFAPTMIDTFPAFRRLLDMSNCDEATTLEDAICLSYFNEQYFIDLLMWYHLAWMGQSLRQDDERVENLIETGQNGVHFTPKDQRVMVEIMADAIEGVIPRYRRLMEAGQIEISMTPYGHPIVPLLIDFDSMKDAQPHSPMPESECYPDGYERAKWHMEHGFKVFEEHFGVKPKGVWLSEGAVSAAAIGLLDYYEIDWTASGEGVWRHSCEASHLDHHDIASKRALYQPLQHATQNCALFFRDDGLSDLIGFQYKDWNPQDAANNFAHNLHNIANALGEDVEDYVVSVILDGENAWEYYPDNAYHFLSALYQTLVEHPQVEMTTFSEALESGVRPRHLPVLKAGSWVYGSFSTWIGEPDKNAGWDLLVDAKLTFDKVMASGKLSEDEIRLATEQLAICEGSDWFWWFGDYNPSGSVKDFDQLFRRHLEKLFILLGEKPPEQLSIPLSYGGGDMENAGTMRRN
ncbi:glycoside hydrolase family 57 protein [Thiomicrospira sp. S5]|jgi:alpha-amylase/alpha-mannosidase (GH57 family)|uniref:glycoside hydrolase family 57 protein n=1 Tax=Thiomicrospira sp. S5 TaxID=1803865 RepID=UPI0004A74A3C|nr:glycoside hydrolase family 57 protein [Thiomicrospira sp. S5]AZR82691.1 glycoside hydrolase [Thiomicrospira sp. S5]